MRRLGVFITVAALGTAFGVSAAGAGENGDLKRFCKANLAINRAFSAEEPDIERVNRILDTIAETAPPDIADAVGVAVPAFQANPESAFEDPAVADAVSQIDGFVYENCGYEQVDVTLEDFAFTGLPDEIERGTTSFRLTNEGAEVHEFVVFRLKGDATLDDLLEAEEEDFEDLVQEVGGGFALPGETGYTTVALRRTGDYAAMCFVPTGTTSETTEGTGPPHFTEGMAAEFEVTS
jgi:hypothetical protein